MKTAILTSVIALVSYHSIAQIDFGIKGGVNRNAYHIRSIDDFNIYVPYFSSKGRIGWHVGVFSSVHLTDHWSLIPELRYVRRGTGESMWAEEVTTAHIEVPLSIQYRITKFVAANIGGVNGYTLAGEIGPWESKDAFRPNTFAIQGGLALRLTNKLSLNATYYRGLNPVLVQTYFTIDHTILERDKYYNTSFLFGLHYTLIKS